MPNINHQVWKIIDKEPSIKKDLYREIINVRALSNYILKRYQIKGSLDSVISAIRRYPKNDLVDKSNKKVSDILKESVIAIKNRLVMFSVKRDMKTLKLIDKIVDFIDLDRGDVIRITQARRSMKIFVNMKNEHNVKKLIPKEEIKAIEPNLAEISVVVSSKAERTEGILASIFNEIASSNINIIETFSCLPEYMIYVNENDILKTHKILLEFFYGTTNNINAANNPKKGE